MPFSLNKFDIPADIKKDIMDMYASETEAYDVQIKDLNKKVKQFADYDEIKTKVSTYESEIEKIKTESKQEILNTKKQYAFDNAIKSSKVSNEKLVKKLMSLDELEYDDENGSFKDFDAKLKGICDEYGISITANETPANTTAQPETKTDTKTSSILSSIIKGPEIPVNTKVTQPTEKKSTELSFVEKLALETKERNERNAKLLAKTENKGGANFINAFLNKSTIPTKKGK